MRYVKVLDNILGQKSKIKVLRFFCKYNKELSIRELSREVGQVPPNISKTLKELEEEGVLKSKKIGKSLVFSLNRGHFLTEKIILPLFQKEDEALDKLTKEIVKKINFPFESIIIFGSVARGEEISKSDIDIAFVVKNSSNVKKNEQEILDINADINVCFGNTLSPIVYRKKDFLKKIEQGDKLVNNIIKDGKIIAGKIISELL